MAKAHRPRLLAIAAVPLAFALTACFGPPPGLPGGSGGIDELIEQIGGDIDVATGTLPADFPVDAVPLVEGEIGIASAMTASEGKRGWQVTVLVPDESAVSRAGELLVEAGYENIAIAYDNGAYLVIVASGEMGGNWGVNYVVTEK